MLRFRVLDTPFSSFGCFGNFSQMVNEAYRSYQPKILNQNFRNFFINGKQPRSLKELKKILSSLQLVTSFPTRFLACQTGGSMGPALIRLLSWGTRAGR